MFDTETLRLGDKEKNTVSPRHRVNVSCYHRVTESPRQLLKLEVR